MSVVIIGESPSMYSGRSVERLAKLCGITVAQFIRTFEQSVNVFEQPVKARNGKGQAYSFSQARERVSLIEQAYAERHVIMLGWRVARTFDLRADRNGGVEQFVPYTHRAFASATIVPHPSGINKWWNDPKNVERAVAFWRSVTPRRRKQRHGERERTIEHRASA